MNDRRSILVGAAALLAALPDTAKAGPDELGYIYAEGVAWNKSLPGLLGQLRLNVYLAVRPDGTGGGLLSDPLHPQINSHVSVLRVLQKGNVYEFHAQIEESNDPGLVGQLLVIPAIVHGEGTMLNLRLGNNVFPGLGRITNVRANVAGLSGTGLAGLFSWF